MKKRCILVMSLIFIMTVLICACGRTTENDSIENTDREIIGVKIIQEYEGELYFAYNADVAPGIKTPGVVSRGIIVYDDYIYYSKGTNFELDESALYRVNLDGENKELIFEDMEDSTFYICDGEIYFTQQGKEYCTIIDAETLEIREDETNFYIEEGELWEEYEGKKYCISKPEYESIVEVENELSGKYLGELEGAHYFYTDGKILRTSVDDLKETEVILEIGMADEISVIMLGEDIFYGEDIFQKNATEMIRYNLKNNSESVYDISFVGEAYWSNWYREGEKIYIYGQPDGYAEIAYYELNLETSEHRRIALWFQP